MQVKEVRGEEGEFGKDRTLSFFKHEQRPKFVLFIDVESPIPDLPEWDFVGDLGIGPHYRVSICASTRCSNRRQLGNGPCKSRLNVLNLF